MLTTRDWRLPNSTFSLQTGKDWPEIQPTSQQFRAHSSAEGTACFTHTHTHTLTHTHTHTPCVPACSDSANIQDLLTNREIFLFLSSEEEIARPFLFLNFHCAQYNEENLTEIDSEVPL